SWAIRVGGSRRRLRCRAGGLPRCVGCFRRTCSRIGIRHTPGTQTVSATDRDQYGVWFPAIRSGTGTDVFTERLAEGLESAGIRTAIDWMPLRAEYAPWTDLRRIV